MFKSYRVGTLLGFPIEINLSFLLLLGVIALWTGLAAGLLFAALAFGSVLVHELGHALVARHLGVRVAGIELHFFGGAAKMIETPRNAGDEIAIAAAGPAVSFALGGLGILAGSLTGLGGFAFLGWLNLIIAGFNLIPALPMDGGRIFRALLTRRMGFVRATGVSVLVARGVAIAMGAIGLLTLQLYLLLLALVLWMMSTAELRLARAGHHYREQGSDADVEVLPRDFSPYRRPVGIVVQHRGNRIVGIDYLD